MKNTKKANYAKKADYAKFSTENISQISPISSKRVWKTITVTSLILVLFVLLFNLTVDLGSTPTGALSVIDVAQDDFNPIIPPNLSDKSASAALYQAEIEIAQMKDKGFPVTLAEDALAEAKVEWIKSNFANVSTLTQFITYLNKEKTDFSDKLALIQEEIKNAEKEGVNVDVVKENLLLAEDSFAKEQIGEAKDNLKLTQDSLDSAKLELERVQLVSRFKNNFFIRNWWQILLGIAIAALLFVPLFKKYRLSMLTWKISSLEIELKKIDGQIRHLQTECFVDGTLPLSKYKVNVVSLEERMAEIKHTLPVLEEQRQRLKNTGSFILLKRREKVGGDKKLVRDKIKNK